MLFTNILIPTDFSQNSSYSYELALNFAKNCSAKLHLLHVIEPVNYSIESSNYPDKHNFERNRMFNAEEELERFINKFSNIGVDICRTVLTGKPYGEILNYAKKENIDLIIISTHGKSNLYHLVAGNVAKKVLKYSEVPVIFVKTNKNAYAEESHMNENFAENWVG